MLKGPDRKARRDIVRSLVIYGLPIAALAIQGYTQGLGRWAVTAAVGWMLALQVIIRKLKL